MATLSDAEKRRGTSAKTCQESVDVPTVRQDVPR